MNRTILLLALVLSTICSPLISMNENAPTIFETKDSILHAMETALTGEAHPLPDQVCLTMLKVDRLSSRAHILAGHEQHTPPQSLDFFEARRLESDQIMRHFRVETNGYLILHQIEAAANAFELPESDPTREGKLLEILKVLSGVEKTLLPIVIDMESRAPEAVLQRALDHRTPLEQMALQEQQETTN